MVTKKKEEVLEKEEEFLEDVDPLPVGTQDPISNETVKMTHDVPVQIVAVLGKKMISVRDLVELKTGQVVDLARPANEVCDLVAGGKLVAKGELVDIDGKLGVRVIKLLR